MYLNGMVAMLMCIAFCTKVVAAGNDVPEMKYRVILADEGNGSVHYVNMADPSEGWSTKCSNRDLQLIGDGRLMAGDNGGNGFSVLDLPTGKRTGHVQVAGVSGGINSTFKLSDSIVYCVRDGSPASIVKIDTTGKVLETIKLSLDASVRICRPTSAGTWLVGGKVAGMMYEFDSTGKKIWECNAGGEPYMAVRMSNGTTLISNGYGGQMVLADSTGNVIKKFPDSGARTQDPAFWKAANPNFFAGFQVLENGNVIVSNWQGHGAGYGNSGYQLLEFDSTLTTVVSYWKQPASIVSSLHGVLVLDGLDTDLLHSDVSGVLKPVKAPVVVKRSGMKRALPGRYLLPVSARTFDLQGRLVRKHSAFARGCRVRARGGYMSLRQIVF